ncbi:hypothetical protein GCM10027343_31770 [Noviherbaspirillum agri]
MKRSGIRFPTCLKGGRLPLLAAAVVLLGACNKNPADPGGPPSAPPRPITFGGGEVITSQLDLPARPVAPPPGEM